MQVDDDALDESSSRVREEKAKDESLHEVVVVSVTRLEQPLLETTSLVSKVSRFR